MANLSNINNKFLVTTGGNVLIGKTAANNATVGTQIMSTGDINPTVNGDTVARFNRLGTDGEIIRFQHDTSTDGAINSSSGRIAIGSGDTGIFFDSIRQVISGHNMTTNSYASNIDLGRSLIPFQNLYLSGQVNAVGASFIGAAASGAALVTIENNSGSTATSYGLLVKGGGDSNSGKIFEVRDSSGNTDLIIKGKGDVGIGTDNPEAKLHVKSSESGAGTAWSNADDLIIENSGNAGLAFQTPNTGAATIAFQDPESVQAGFIQYLHGDNALRFATNGNNERMRIDNVGVLNFPNTAAGTGTGGSIAHYTNNYMYIKGGTGGLAIGDDGFDAAIYLNNSDSIQFQTGGSERMRIDSSGAINIGTRRAALPSYFGYSSTYKTLILGSSGTNYQTDAVTLSLGVDVSGNPSGSYNGSGREIIIRNEGSFISPNAANNGYNNIMSWNSSGQPYFIQNVGIGVTSPGANLEVKTLVGGSGAATLRLNTNFGSGNAVDINPFISGVNNAGMEIKLAGSQKLVIQPTGNVGIGTTSPGDAKLYVNGGTTLAGNNTSAGAIRMYGDRKLPQANNFVRRNYNLTASSGGALYSIARQWHDVANWGLGNINVIMWGIYYGQGQFNKADFSCRYGYSGNSADVQTNFNSNSMNQPAWTAATQVSGNIYYRDLQIQIPAYHQISFEIISPGLAQTYNINNTAHNTVYLYPH